MNPRSRVPWVPITKVHCYVTQSTKLRLHVQIPLSPKEKQEFKSYTCIFKKRTPLFRNKEPFSSGLQQIFLKQFNIKAIR